MEKIIDKYEELISKYPILFKQRTASPTETCMCWGIEAGYGWFIPLDNLCSYLEELNKIYYSKYKVRIQADQVKSKYGELRFYYSIIDDNFDFLTNEYQSNYKFIIDMLNNITDALINQTVDTCWNVCEWCGADGGIAGENLVTTHGWISRICKKCAKDKAEKEAKHYDEINNEEYVPRITWFHEGYEFLNLYHVSSFKYNQTYYNSIIEAFYCEKDFKHKKLYQKIVEDNKNKKPYTMEVVANDAYNIYLEESDYNLLKDIVKAKFTYEFNENIKKELLETEGKVLQNMGRHHNNLFGYCICDNCKDKDHKDLYGKILMEVRTELLK